MKRTDTDGSKILHKQKEVSPAHAHQASLKYQLTPVLRRGVIINIPDTVV